MSFEWDRNVNCQENIPNADQVRVDGNNGMVVEQSSVSNTLDERTSSKATRKGLPQRKVCEDDGEKRLKRTYDEAFGNEFDFENPDSKRPRYDAPNDSSRGGVEKPLNQQGVMKTQNSEPSQPVAKTPIYTVGDAISKLNGYFKESEFDFKKFDFKEFAKVNGVAVKDGYIPRSDVVSDGFLRMYNVVYVLLSIFSSGKAGAIKLTPEEAMDTIARVNQSGLSNDEDKAYKLYGELGVVIFRKMNNAVQNPMFDNSRDALFACLLKDCNMCKSVLSLPLVNFGKGINFCKRMTGSTLTGVCGIFELSEPKLTDEERTDPGHQKLVNDFKKLGMFFAFRNDELGEKLLPAAQFATSIGMKMPLFMAEMMTSKTSEIFGLSNDIVGVVIRDTTVSRKDDKGFPLVNHVFYHEITHHAKSAVGAINMDISLMPRNETGKLVKMKLTDILKDNSDIIGTINSQISNYALTDYEEYIAEFSALVLCCLGPKETEQGKIEQNANPFDYIQDERLWRLYYEFGGPDFAPIIQQKGFLPAGYAEGCNILSDKGCDWCSGYPSKFDIDVNQIKDQQVKVEGMTAIGQRSFVKIDEKTILPPPPLGYCYTTENGKLQLKIDKSIDVLKDSTDNTLYDPVFCCLTDGPLTLMKTEPQWIHHFEVLKNENSAILELSEICVIQ